MRKVCPRCNRIAVGWILERGDRCSPREWARCIREPQAEWEDATADADLLIPKAFSHD